MFYVGVGPRPIEAIVLHDYVALTARQPAMFGQKDSSDYCQIGKFLGEISI